MTTGTTGNLAKLGRHFSDEDSARELLESLELSNRVFVLSARSLDVFATLPLRKLVDQSWDLDGLAKGYRDFAQRFAAFGNLHVPAKLTPAESFIVRTLLIHWFRRVTLHDPQIPAELLPDHWPGHVAYEMCHRIYQGIYRDAEPALLDAPRRQLMQGLESSLGRIV